MINRRALLAAPVLAAPLAGCIVPEYRTRFRLMIDGVFEGRKVFGSSVMERAVSDPNHWWTGGVLISRYRGEATLVDLGADRVLVALMHRWNAVNAKPFPSYEPGWAPGRAFRTLVSAESRWKGGRNAAEAELSRLKSSPTVLLTPREMPVMAVFESRHDPNSGVILAYGATGPTGFTLTRAAVEITRDRLFTGKPAETFPWLESLNDTGVINGAIPVSDIIKRKFSR